MELPRFPIVPKEMFLMVGENGQEIPEEVRQASERKYRREVKEYKFWKEKNPAQPLSTPLDLPVLSRTEQQIVFQIPLVKKPIALKKMIFKSQLAKEVSISPYYLAGEVTIKENDIDLNKFLAYNVGVRKEFLKSSKLLYPSLGDTAVFNPSPLNELIPQLPHITIQFRFPSLSKILTSIDYFCPQRQDFLVAQKWEWQETTRGELCLLVTNNLADIILSSLVLTMSSFDIAVSLV